MANDGVPNFIGGIWRSDPQISLRALTAMCDLKTATFSVK